MDRMAERLSPSTTTKPHSPLHRIKASSSNPSVGGMKRLLAREENLQAGFRFLIDFLILRSGRVVFQLKDHQKLTGHRPVLTCLVVLLDLYYL